MVIGWDYIDMNYGDRYANWYATTSTVPITNTSPTYRPILYTTTSSATNWTNHIAFDSNIKIVQPKPEIEPCSDDELKEFLLGE